MANKIPYSIADQISLLKQRGMLFKNEREAYHFLSNISYYRLKGYWWDMQDDFTLHTLKPNSYFEDVFDRYNFDRHLRIILFDAIERIEIALRTKMIYYLSLSHGSLWYLNANLFEQTILPTNPSVSIYQNIIQELQKEFNRSHEIFIKDQKNRYKGQDADAWKIMEVASMGTLSKFYKILKHQLPEKAIIAQEMGLNLHNELSSWLEGITYVRNIVAHHSRLWSRNLVKVPIEKINNPNLPWFKNPLLPVQKKKPFLIISTMLFLCNKVIPNHQIKDRIIELIGENPNIPIYKLGFLNNWEQQPIWL
jgi:abortive infection bacteriophage resistance protein